MRIETQLSEKEYIQAVFAIVFHNPFPKIFIGISIVAILISIMSILIPAAGMGPRAGLPWLVITAVWTVILYFSAKRGYKSQKRVSEMIAYTFEDDYLIIDGESFHSQLTWDKLHKVTQTKKWVLLWSSSNMAHVIRKENMDATQITYLKEIAEKHGLKNNL